ncbi:MAG TPA: hypothetical protein VMA09_14155 [Candidatus Binataceae bacterium]|nr:hypothetical protein [Candidatus Binataceae bacterium]
MKKSTITGAVLAVGVALLFAHAPARADDSQAAKTVKCVGGNSCKGQSACQTETSSCAGQNACKGKGWVKKASAKECKDVGGKPEKM